MSAIRHTDGRHIIEEHDARQFGEYRFALDRRDGGRLVNVGWYKTLRGALAAMSLDRAASC